jgi:hypothetical protein
MAVTGLPILFKVDRGLRTRSVIVKSKDDEGFVLNGFLTPFTVILKLCRGFMPATPFLKVS